MAFDHSNQIISYLTQRKFLGYLGISLPFLVFIGTQFEGATPLLNSISAYYFTNVREIFVTVLAALSIFFITYKGYTRLDNVLTNIAGVLALNIALFPSMRETNEVVHYLFAFIPPNATDIIHLCSASTFFLILSFISYFIFTKTGNSPMTSRKIVRNRVYRACGIILFSALVVMGIYELFSDDVKLSLQIFRPIFVFESISLFAFGTSWLVKGGVILRDK